MEEIFKVQICRMEAIFQEKQKKRALTGFVLILAVRLALKIVFVDTHVLRHGKKRICMGQMLNLLTLHLACFYHRHTKTCSFQYLPL